MNILNLLTKEKHVAGIEISGKFIRIAYFLPKKRFEGKKHDNAKELPERELVLIEEPIPAGAIGAGGLVNKELLGKTLKDIWTKAKLGANYAIVAIPSDKIYSHIFPFPNTVVKAHLEEAVNLAIDFQLPFKKEDMYIGWEDTSGAHTANEVLVSAMPKAAADIYIKALDYAGIKILALESHLAAFARSINLAEGQAALFVKENSDGNVIFILKDGFVRFSRALPASFVTGKNFVDKEKQNIKISFEADKGIPLVEPAAKDIIREEYLKYPQFKGSNPESIKWLVAIGAAVRGEIPKGQDSHISLLPVGTAEAYDYQKAATFITLVRNMTIGVSIFFLVSFLASYLFILSLSQRVAETSSNISASPVLKNMLEREAWVKRINEITRVSETIISTAPNWSILLEDITSHVISGITISKFSAASVADQISVSGTAKNRDTLNQFKKSLQTSEYLTKVELPITNLEQKENIPFSILFFLKDPEVLYNK